MLLPSILVSFLIMVSPALAQVSFETDTFSWSISANGWTTALVDKTTSVDVKQSSLPICELITEAGRFLPESVSFDGELFNVKFEKNSGSCAFKVTRGPCQIVFKLVDYQTSAPLISITLCQLTTPQDGIYADLINAWRGGKTSVALQGTSVAVRTTNGGDFNRGGIASSGSFARAEFNSEAKVDAGAGKFMGHNPTDEIAWTCWYQNYPQPLDLTGHAGIGFWVKGDGKGESLKIQLTDGFGQYRDYYITIDFAGWQYHELPVPMDEAIDYTHITQCNLYFNNIAPQTDVECLVDDIRAIMTLDGQPEPAPDDIVLADMDSMQMQYFSQDGIFLVADGLAEYGLEDAGFVLTVCPSEQLAEALAQTEEVAGLPSPHFNGQWNKTSFDIKRSYLFITSFNYADTEMVIDFAKKCGFSCVLIGDSSWMTSLGKFPINTVAFPRGIDDLRDTISRFHAAGLRAGLHWLAAAIDANSEYVTPIPDDRLVITRFAELAEPMDEQTDYIQTIKPPTGFPEHDGGYLGDSTLLRIGDELISYDGLSLQVPFGFKNCQRGLFGTKVIAHDAGDKIAHVKRSYNLILHDPDKGLTQEVAQNLAQVANYCNVDMVYFDGSENLKGPHWRYNGLLHKAYYDALGRDDILMQASSVSPWSWHMLARCASADGHGDLKWYLDQRIPGFDWYNRNLMPLDLGWYYIYGEEVTPDQIEYVCQKALGYNCSFSLQTNPDTIRNNPRIAEYMHVIKGYEDLRLSGVTPSEMLEHLRIPGEEYRLAESGDTPEFTRRNYGERIYLTSNSESASTSVKIDSNLGQPKLGIEFRAGGQTAPGPEYDAADNWLLEDFEDISGYLVGGKDNDNLDTASANLAGATSQGVTQKLELVSDNVKLGKHCARYTATSTRTDNDGWSAVGRTFDAPLDISDHVALGVWIYGDNSGAQVKIQPRGGAGNWAQDHYMRIDFSGWRFVLFTRPEKPNPEPIEYDTVKSLTLYFNGIPAGKTCSVLIDGLKALRHVEEVKASMPVIQAGNSSLKLSATLAENEWLVITPQGEATLYSPGKEPVSVTVEGQLTCPLDGDVNVEFRPDINQNRELSARAWVEYE